MIVGEVRGDFAHRGLDLDVDETLVSIDIEQSLGGVGDAPDHDGGDLDGVAALVVHLELLAGDVADAETDLGSLVPWQHPAQARRAIGALVVAEQGDGGCFVGLQRVEAGEDEDEQDDQHGHQQRHRPIVVGNGLGQRPECKPQNHKAQEQHQAAVIGVGFALVRPIQRCCGHDLPSRAIKVISL